MVGARAAPGSHRTFEIVVALKAGVADAEGESVARALGLLGISGVRSVRTARVFTIVFDGPGARARADEAVARLLANPVIHRVRVRPVPG